MSFSSLFNRRSGICPRAAAGGPCPAAPAAWRLPRNRPSAVSDGRRPGELLAGDAFAADRGPRGGRSRRQQLAAPLLSGRRRHLAAGQDGRRLADEHVSECILWRYWEVQTPGSQAELGLIAGPHSAIGLPRYTVGAYVYERAWGVSAGQTELVPFRETVFDRSDTVASQTASTMRCCIEARCRRAIARSTCSSPSRKLLDDCRW